MDEQLYRDIILDHWKHPQNYGAIENADIDLKDYNPLCGDEVHLTARVENEKIKDIKFESQGCAISKAAASILTETIKHLPVKEAKNLSQDAFLELLEVKLTPSRLKCALLAYSALQKALSDSA